MHMASKLVLALLVLAWVPVTSHCTLESVPGFEFLQCASEDESTSGNGHGCNDSCCSVEFAKYQGPRHQDHIPLHVATLVPFDPIADVERSLPSEVSLGILTAAPPELPKVWQFLSRTALPPRAPSLA